VRYYPKLVLAAPFTPATGPRLLAPTDAEKRRLIPALAQGIEKLLGPQGLSSAHVLFPTESESGDWEAAGLAVRLGIQFQWHNRGFSSFDDFLTVFSSKKRNQIRRERRDVVKQGIHVKTLRGAEITEDVVLAMYDFYTSTVDKFMWGRRYLNRKFF